MVDLIIRGGSLIDGTGAAARQADIAIHDGQIVAVGALDLDARETIDATGKLVTPGWVDVHTHFDGQATWDPFCSPSGHHGVTTVVMGSCGVGFAPCAPDKRDYLIKLMEGVEDIPGSALVEGIKWDWESFPEYLDALEKMPRTLDIGAQIGHGPLRAYVMGERAFDREAQPDDVTKMSAIVEDAIRAGALGFSTSRTLLHKDSDGVVVPGTFASRDELFGIGHALARAGNGIFQIAQEHLQVPEQIDWMADLAKETGRPVCFNLSQTDFAKDLWRQAVEKVDAARAEGTPLFFQVAGRAIGIVMSWRATAHPFATHPSFAMLAGKPWNDVLATLRDPAFKAKLIAEAPQPPGMFEAFVTQTFTKMFPLRSGTDYEPTAEESIAARAQREDRAALEIAYEMLMAHDGTGMIYFPLFNYADGNLDVLRELHQHPASVMGLSDAGAHCGAICDGGMPTFMVTFWARDRQRGGHLPLEWLVKRQTADTAKFFGLHDRGIIAPGYLGDVNIIDYDQLALEAPELRFDLPAGGRRLVQDARGYRYTIKRGQVVMLDGQHTGALPGKVIRGPQTAPEAAAAK